MKISPASFNGFLLQQAGKVATDWKIPFDWNILGIGTTNIPRSQNFPLFTSKEYSGSVKILNINFTGTADVTKNDFIIAMDVLGDEQHQLIAKDIFGREWYVNASCIAMTELGISEDTETASFAVAFDVSDPIWSFLVPSEEEILVNVTGSGTITPIGNQFAAPTIKITPTGAGGGSFAYKKFVQITNNASNPLTSYPLNLTGAGLDTAALINFTGVSNQINQGGGINAVVTTIPIDTAVGGGLPTSGMGYCGTEQISWTGNSGTQLTGVTRGIGGTTAAVHADNAVIALSKMLANGDDLRINIDGVEVKRWFGGGGINSSTTKIWINWDQPTKQDMTLGGVIAGAGSITQISIQNTAGNVALLPTIPTTGNVLIGTEIFVYTGVDVGALKLTGITRAARLTSAGAHAIGDAVKFVTHDVWMYYGYAGITPYVVDDTYKPMIKLTSLNTSWIFEEFGTVAGLRSATWAQRNFSSTNWLPTTGDGFLTGVDPYTAVGHKNINGVGYVGSSGWMLYQPCGITHLTVTGKKQRSIASWPVTAGVNKSVNGSTFTNVWVEASPVGTGSPENLDAHANVALGGTYNYILSSFATGSLGPAIYQYEVSDLTATIDSTKVPTITFSTETTNFTLNSVLTNDVVVNGTAMEFVMQLSLSMTIGKYLLVDTKNNTITLEDGTNSINALIDMPIRFNWFPLYPGVDNDISITDPGQVTYEFIYEDRTL